jgi:hypothetical protein
VGGGRNDAAREVEDAPDKTHESIPPGRWSLFSCIERGG